MQEANEAASAVLDDEADGPSFEEIIDPGEAYTAGDAGEYRIKVFCLGVRQMRKFKKAIQKIVATITSHPLPEGLDEKEMGRRLMGPVSMVVLEDAIELVEACTIVKLADPENPDRPFAKLEAAVFDDLPHYVVPEIIERWVLVSFGSENRFRPWKVAAERLIEKLTGERLSISEMLSKFSLPPARPDEKSSSTDNRDSPTTAGASSSSSTGSAGPSDS